MIDINEEFTNEEYARLTEIRNQSELNWHDFIVISSEELMKCRIFEENQRKQLAISTQWMMNED